MFVRSGSKRQLRRLSGVEVEVLPTDDNSSARGNVPFFPVIVKLRKEDLATENEVEAQGGSVEQEQQAISRYKREVLDLEDLIPWNGVTKTWKGKRSSWRKKISDSRTLQDIGEGLKALLRCLVWGKEYRIVHCPLQWENEIDDVCKDHADFLSFAKLWKRLSLEIRQWIQDRNQPRGMHFISIAFSRKTALLAFHRLKEAVAHGNDALRQVPLADIINHDPLALAYLKEMLVSENVKNHNKSQATPPSTPMVGKKKAN